MVETVKKQTSRIKTRKTVNLNKQYLCKNITNGELYYHSKKSGYTVLWNTYGDEQWIDGRELVDMNSSQPAFTHRPWIYIEDEAMAEHLGVQDIQKQAHFAVDIDKLFSMTATEVENIVAHMNPSLKSLVLSKAKRAIRTGKLNDFSVIRSLNTALGKNIIQLANLG